MFHVKHFYISKFSANFAFSYMKSFLGSTFSPIKSEKISFAAAAQTDAHKAAAEAAKALTEAPKTEEKKAAPKTDAKKTAAEFLNQH